MAQPELYHGPKGSRYLWLYVPSMPASIIFIVMFSIASAFHIWKAGRTRAAFCIPFIIGGLLEVAGYATRAYCTDRTAELIPFIVQNILILLAPVLLAASIYMFLARLIISVGADRYSLIRVTRLTKVFVAGDIISFLVQGTGGGMAATEKMADKSQGVVIGGLMVQIVVFGFFIITSTMFEVRMRRNPLAPEFAWVPHLYPLYTVSALIMVRSVFRVIEYAMGEDGYLLSNELPMYVFDAALMLAVMAIWGYWHPGVLREDMKDAQLVSMNSPTHRARRRSTNRR
ncbi:RTA1 like protein-domain-containing protein [Aspergillus karnatakaensis]|uniref:RTA1 domain-containing protein n=1 Tax=Aspergillus karnatakaensis TaxID=1810916 RepID=UPI003CCE32A0